MTTHNQKKQNQANSGINPVVAAATGAVVGAGAVIAGVVALNDQKNRAKVDKVVKDVKNHAKDHMAEVGDKFAEGKEKVRKVASSVKDSMRRGVKDAEKAAQSK
jgi:hypothetical protein